MIHDNTGREQLLCLFQSAFSCSEGHIDKTPAQVPDSSEGVGACRVFSEGGLLLTARQTKRDGLGRDTRDGLEGETRVDSGGETSHKTELL